MRNLSTSNRQKARYVFSIYRADGLPNRKSNIYCGNLKNNINPYIQVSFAGMKVSQLLIFNFFSMNF